ncbi:MAG: hypothetical protein VB064_02360 [Oscillospiraceae bacterium]|nr:hypothetical protein [Oscillospiraceae bacterium]
MKKLQDISITAAVKLQSFGNRLRSKLKDDSGTAAMDNGVIIVIVVALGGIVLALLIAYFKGDFADNLKSKIGDFFSQS